MRLLHIRIHLVPLVTHNPHMNCRANTCSDSPVTWALTSSRGRSPRPPLVGGYFLTVLIGWVLWGSLSGMQLPNHSCETKLIRLWGLCVHCRYKLYHCESYSIILRSFIILGFLRVQSIGAKNHVHHDIN